MMKSKKELGSFLVPEPSDRRPRRRNRESTQKALIVAAASVFSDKGYEGATTRAIAEAAGCSEGLIHRYFANKEGLLLAVLRTEIADNEYSPFLDLPLQTSVEEEARQILFRSVRSMTERSELMRVVLSRVMLDPAFRSDFNRISVRGSLAVGLEPRLRRYADAGLIDQEVDVAAAAELLISLSFQVGFVHRELHQTSSQQVQKLIEDFAVLFGRAVSLRR